MNSLGSEVGQKMRSAVKAKLIELGTGGTAGYIDDELPDYVMIMVANKRSKEQMIGDLNLFLGSHTELFVTWLHEVLQKLQEVTLPINVSHKLKRKATETENSSTAKKDKKEKKKDKAKKASEEGEIDESSAASITDVFAEQLLQKARKNIELETSARVKEKKEKSPTVRQIDEFDIPTITEIAGQRAVEDRRKELTELEDIQNKIYLAKRQLRAIESDESEDGDLLNIKQDPEEFEEEIQEKTNRKEKRKSPILFNSKDSSSDQERQRKRHTPIVFTENDTSNDRTPPLPRRRPIHDRLGSKSNENVVSLSTHRRVEKELYIPAFRRREMEREKSKERRRELAKDERSGWELKKDKEQEKVKNLERDQEKGRNSQSCDRARSSERERCRDRDREKLSKEKKRDEKVSVRHRIGSRIIVAPPKPECEEDENDGLDRPISSIVKIKPRPPMSPSRQASKNLLLRAVAEAQRSTALIKPKKDVMYASDALPLKKKSSRDHTRESLYKRAAKDNIVIEVNAEQRSMGRVDSLSEDEYIPEPISDRGDSDNDYIYVPQTINSGNSEDDYDGPVMDSNLHRNRTQFVVTLDDKSQEKYVTKHKIRVVGKNVNGVEIKRWEINNEIVPTRPKSQVSSHKNNSTRAQIQKLLAKSVDAVQRNEKPKEVKKLIIKNDSDDDEVPVEKKPKVCEDRSLTPPPKTPLKSPVKQKRRTVSPIKFDLHHEDDNKSSTENEKEDHASAKKIKLEQMEDEEKEKETEKEKQKISTKKTDASKKYDNLPELLSSIPVEVNTLKPSKPKERCKYFPSCTKGESCEFLHPTTMCKMFPNCKFAEKCLYLHPKCKFDMTCSRTACNFTHSMQPAASSAAPPLLSHVVPVQNYKTISAAPLPAICKFYPNCTNNLCNFYHPKLCRFGKNCMNKVECNFYHYDLPIKDKFKWVASLG